MLLKDAGDNPFKRAEAINEIVTSITKISDPIKRQIFFKRTADLMKMDEQTLISEGNKHLRRREDKATEKPAQSKPKDRFRERRRSLRISTFRIILSKKNSEFW